MNRRIAALIFALILLTVFATSFAFINSTTVVRVWPLTSNHSMTLVITVSLAGGAALGALLMSLLHHRGEMPFVSKSITAVTPPAVSSRHARK